MIKVVYLNGSVEEFDSVKDAKDEIEEKLNLGFGVKRVFELSEAGMCVKEYDLVFKVELEEIK